MAVEPTTVGLQTRRLTVSGHPNGCPGARIAEFQGVPVMSRAAIRSGGFGLSVSLDIEGTWPYHLRAPDPRVECDETVAIEVVPDSQRRAIGP